MTKSIKLTANELTALRAIDRSEYGDCLLDAIWSWSIADNCDLKPRSIPGVVSSLSKKGLVRASGGGEEASVGMTRLGAETYRAANGGVSSKWLERSEINQ